MTDFQTVHALATAKRIAAIRVREAYLRQEEARMRRAAAEADKALLEDERRRRHAAGY